MSAMADHDRRDEQPTRAPQGGPTNIDAERSVLGSILLDPQILASVDAELPAGAETFSLGAHQQIFAALKAMATDGIEPSIVSVCDHMRKAGTLDSAGGYMAIANLEQFVVATSSAAAHARIVRTCWQYRQIIEAARTAAQSSNSATPPPPEEVIEAACQKFLGLVDANASNSARFVRMDDLMEDTVLQAQAAAEARRRGEVVGVPTGIADLDKMIGGFRPGTLTVLAARPSIGKTSVAIEVFRHACLRLRMPVAFFSIEMPGLDIGTRIACAEAGVSTDRTMRGFASEYELAKIRAAASDIAESPGLLSDSPRLSGVQLLLRTKLLQAQHPDLGLIIIDGLWLMDHQHQRGSNRAAEVGQTVHLIKAAAKETGVPILLLHQLNRANEQRASKREIASGSGGRPILSDLRETGDVEQDADLVIFLHRERRELGTPDEPRDSEAAGEEPENDLDREPNPYARGPVREGPSPLVSTELIVAKNRNGPTGTVKALFDLVSQRWLPAATERP